MNAGLLMVGTACSVFVAPIAAVALVNRVGAPTVAVSGRAAALWAIMWRLFALALAVSTLVMALVLVTAPMSASLAGVAAPFACLACATLALAAWGGFSACCFADPLDAAGCALAMATVVAFGVLVAGPVVSAAPTAAINAALAASPLVATASAASFDLLRTDVLYRLSPIAHVRFDYPDWPASVTLYLVLAAAGFAAVAVTLTRLVRRVPAERM